MQNWITQGTIGARRWITLLHEQGWNHEWIELQLAHTQRNAVSAAYNHALYLEPRAKMMQAWADYLERMLRTGST